MGSSAGSTGEGLVGFLVCFLCDRWVEESYS